MNSIALSHAFHIKRDRCRKQRWPAKLPACPSSCMLFTSALWKLNLINWLSAIQHGAGVIIALSNYFFSSRQKLIHHIDSPHRSLWGGRVDWIFISYEVKHVALKLCLCVSQTAALKQTNRCFPTLFDLLITFWKQWYKGIENGRTRFGTVGGFFRGGGGTAHFWVISRITY